VALAIAWPLTMTGPVRAQAPSRSAAIAAAVVPLPGELRPGAGVVTLEAAGQPRTLRPSTNGLICIADRPGDPFFAVECYHASFIPVVYRMKQLVARGMPEPARDDTIEADIKTGRLKLPAAPTFGYLATGPIAAYDAPTNTIGDAIQLGHRMFIPYATEAPIGVTTADDSRHPYLMAAGTYYAHVMLPTERPVPRTPPPCMGPSGLRRVPDAAPGTRLTAGTVRPRLE
jgi:hypothetical protein